MTPAGLYCWETCTGTLLTDQEAAALCLEGEGVYSASVWWEAAALCLEGEGVYSASVWWGAAALCLEGEGVRCV